MKSERRHTEWGVTVQGVALRAPNGSWKNLIKADDAVGILQTEEHRDLGKVRKVPGQKAILKFTLFKTLLQKGGRALVQI